MPDKSPEKEGSDVERDQVASQPVQTEEIGHEEERIRRNQEWSPSQDTEYQTGGGPHSEEDAEEASKTAESGF